MTRLFNLSVQNADIPAIWRSANIIPVPKPGKPQDQGGSYRPISLLCPEIKILERLHLPSLSSSLIPNSTQHGFRPNQSTVTALFPLVTSVARGFNAPKPAERTGLLSIDLSKAFDIVERDRLVEKVDATNLHPNLKRWLAAYLRDRKTRVVYQGATSGWRKSKTGVPQGSVISPVLFNFFVADLKPSSAAVSESYVDDFHAAETSSDIDSIATALSATAQEYDVWAEENGMLVSASKSTTTLFTPWTRQVNFQLPVVINNVPVPT